MTTTTPESRARIAYTAYGKVTGFKNAQGNPMPIFDDLPPADQGCVDSLSRSDLGPGDHRPGNDLR